MARVDVDEVTDGKGKVLSRASRIVTDEEEMRIGAVQRLQAIPDSALKETPWGPIIADILRIVVRR